RPRGRLHPRSPRDQIPRRPAQHRDRLRAGRGHADPGAVLAEGPDTARAGDAGGDELHHHPAAAKGREDAVMAARDAAPSPLWGRVARVSAPGEGSPSAVSSVETDPSPVSPPLRAGDPPSPARGEGKSRSSIFTLHGVVFENLREARRP